LGIDEDAGDEGSFFGGTGEEVECVMARRWESKMFNIQCSMFKFQWKAEACKMLLYFTKRSNKSGCYAFYIEH
jgi:hypothetical protein